MACSRRDRAACDAGTLQLDERSGGRPLEHTLIDSHVHLWDPRRFRMPWLDDLPSLQQPFELAEFDAARGDLQVEAMVYLQVDVTPAYGLQEARWVAEHYSRADAIVAYAPIEDGPIVRTYLDDLVRISPRIHGVRRLLQSEAPDYGVQRDFLRGLRELPRYGLTFDVCVTHRQLAQVPEMVRACPETTFILDHLGKPDVRANRLDPWREHISHLADLPNVVCKLSGLVTEADHESWTPADLQPYVGHVLNAFGEDRVLFGGDWPVVTLAGTYMRWVETLRELTGGLSAEAQRKLWSANARRVYRL